MRAGELRLRRGLLKEGLDEGVMGAAEDDGLGGGAGEGFGEIDVGRLHG